jgi:hypothetical protein
MITTKVTKNSVSKAMEGMWMINLTLDILDDGKVVSTRDFSVRYKAGQDIGIVTSAIKEEMQKATDDYMMEQKLFAESKLDAAITSLNQEITAKAVI